MRIIDKNTDFYDYLQNVYRDPSVTFDRTDSFLLTKEDVLQFLDTGNRWKYRFVLLQVCHSFWFFLVEAIYDEADRYSDGPVGYSVELLSVWKDYTGKRNLISLTRVEFWFDKLDFISEVDYRKHIRKFNKDSIISNVGILKDAIRSGDLYHSKTMESHTVWYGDGHREEKHIPILRASGFAQYIDPLEIYQSIEEYFSLEKQASERTDSVGLTDIEKIENHGFDKKISFRGK